MKNYLALGDSYTIGELVDAVDNFPNQAVAILNRKLQRISAPKIIAVTGHTTDELLKDIELAQIESERFDFVTLLIGVNNQYRGRSVNEFKEQFEELLMKSVLFAKGKRSNVFVLSIPDWGITPFAHDRDAQQITAEIDAYNAACKQVATEFGVSYIDITRQQRVNGYKTAYLASDGLHPSALEYAQWAERLAQAMEPLL